MDGANQLPRDRSVIGSRELPIPKGRVSWFIARWEAAQAKRRTVNPQRRAATSRHIYNRVTWHLWPWTCREYPGRAAIVAAICGVSDGTAMHYGKTAARRLPRHIALMLADYLRSHAAQSLALAIELEAHAKASEAINPRGVGFREVRVRDATGIPRDGRTRKAP